MSAAVPGAALLLALALLALTAHAAATGGFDAVTLLPVPVLALVAVGIVGGFPHRPEQ
jgi:hypothetical protein